MAKHKWRGDTVNPKLMWCKRCDKTAWIFFLPEGRCVPVARLDKALAA